MRAARFLLAFCVAATAAPAFAAERWIAHPSQPFDILATEATVDEFLACVASGDCRRDSADDKCNLGDKSRGAHPINCIDHDGAEALCKQLGGRLCSSKEWLSACRGSDKCAFPYGPEFQPSRCHVGSYDRPGPGGRTTIAAGSVRDCEGGLPGLFDMSGNVKEWVTTNTTSNPLVYEMRGGAYNTPSFNVNGTVSAVGLQCDASTPAPSVPVRLPSVGFRCCRTGMLPN